MRCPWPACGLGALLYEAKAVAGCELEGPFGVLANAEAGFPKQAPVAGPVIGSAEVKGSHTGVLSGGQAVVHAMRIPMGTG